MKFKITIFFVSVLFFYSFTDKKNQAEIIIDTETVISKDYIGNGVQWDPYQLDYGKGKVEISEADWQKLYARLDFMRPQFIRVMINTTSQLENGELVPEKNIGNISPILDYCQSRNITVMFGDWGGGMVNARTNEINGKNLKYAATYLDYLVNQKKYSCIKYYNMINEPNGDWSVTNTSYPLWASAISQMHKEMKTLNLDEKVGLVGPDAAIWTEEEAWWIDSCAVQLGDIIQLYDIHTYPSKVTVNSGEYTDIIGAYKDKVPAGKKIVMGEIGFKFVEEADSLYNRENIRRAKSKPYASIDDSQMFVYDYMYGTDMAGALFQTVNRGYSGSIVWMLDDAMHSKEAHDKLKVWGFWNILGDEYFGEEEEMVRPWYYAWSLLSKYMPTGSTIYKADIKGDSNIKAIVSEKGDRYMIAVVNVSKEQKEIAIKSKSLTTLAGCKQFIYSDGTLKKEGDHTLLPNETGLNLNLDKGIYLTMPAESLVVYTNFEY